MDLSTIIILVEIMTGCFMGTENDKSPDDTNLDKVKDQASPPANRPHGRLFRQSVKPSKGKPTKGKPIGPSKSKQKKR